MVPQLTLAKTGAWWCSPASRPTNWPVPRFTPVFLPPSVPNREHPVTVEQLGNTVLAVNRKGR